MTTRQDTLIPLVVLKQRAYCDSPARHEMTLYTDGILGYALTADESTHNTDLRRTGAIIEGECVEDNCGASVQWDLTLTEWTGDVSARQTIRDHGQYMELL